MSLRVVILGSGSSGNAAFVATERVRLLVDAGFSYRSLEKRLAAIGERPEDLDAVLISHEHSDHIAGLPRLVKRISAPLYMTPLTRASIDWKDLEPRIESFEAGSRFVVGDVEIDTFTVPHDAVDPVGFSIKAGGVKVSLVTDLGYMPESVKRHIRGSDMLVLESNHDLEMLKVGPYPWFVKQRVMSRVGHLSNQAVSDFLVEEFDRCARVLVLAHLSGNNNHPEIARMFAGQALERAGAAGVSLRVAGQREPSEVFEF